MLTKVVPIYDAGEESEEQERLEQQRQARIKDRKDARMYLWKVFLRFSLMSIISFGAVALFIICRFAVHNSCVSGFGKILVTPNFAWCAVWDYGYLVTLGGIVVVTARNLASPTRMRLTRGEMVAIVATFALTYIVLIFGVLQFAKNPRLMIFARVAGGGAMLIVYYYFAKNRAKVTKSPAADVSVRARFRRQNDRIAFGLLKFALTFFAGFYFALMFSDADFALSFPSIMQRVKNETTNIWIHMAFEVGLVTWFYSVFFPSWAKFLGRHVQELCRLYLFNIHSSKEQKQTITAIDAPDRCDFYDGDEKNLTAQQMARTAENVLMCMMLVINFWLDATRFVYGRGILFKLSSTKLFFLVVFKDICYQIWHFGFKYVDWAIVFTVKTFHVEGLGNVSIYWQILASVVQFIVHVGGIPKALCCTWQLPIDYAALKDRPDSHTSCSVNLTFCNVSMKLFNLPDSFKDDLAESVHQMCGSMHLADPPSSELGEEFGTYRQCQRGISRPPAMSEARVDTESATNNLKCPPVSQATGRKLSCILEDPPVTMEEKCNFKDLISIVQTQIFMRYQVRAVAKIFTAFVFLLIPLIARFTPLRYHALFDDFNFFGDTEVSEKYRIAAITFLVVDICEWISLSSIILYNTEFAAPMARYFYSIVSSHNKPLRVMCAFSSFAGVFLFQMKWKPFSLDAVNTALGHTAENQLDWHTIYNKCF